MPADTSEDDHENYENNKTAVSAPVIMFGIVMGFLMLLLLGVALSSRSGQATVPPLTEARSVAAAPAPVTTATTATTARSETQLLRVASLLRSR